MFGGARGLKKPQFVDKTNQLGKNTARFMVVLELFLAKYGDTNRMDTQSCSRLSTE